KACTPHRGQAGAKTRPVVPTVPGAVHAKKRCCVHSVTRTVSRVRNDMIDGCVRKSVGCGGERGSPICRLYDTDAARNRAFVSHIKRAVSSPRRRAEKSRNAGYGAKQRLDSPGNTTISCYGKAAGGTCNGDIVGVCVWIEADDVPPVVHAKIGGQAAAAPSEIKPVQASIQRENRPIRQRRKE